MNKEIKMTINDAKKTTVDIKNEFQLLEIK